MRQEINKIVPLKNKLISVRTKRRLFQYDVTRRAKITKECYQLTEKVK